MPKTATTMAPEDMPTTLGGIRYEAAATHIQAQRDSKDNLIMSFKLNHQKREALFSCDERERVGVHSPREIQFKASDDCILHFDNPRALGTDKIKLTHGVPYPHQVDDTIDGQETTFWVEYIPKPAAATSMQSTAPTVASIKPFAPPVIVVP